MTADDADVLGRLIESARERATGPCAGDNLIAAWAEDRLDERRREIVEAHLADCDACRKSATELRALVTDAPGTPSPRASSAVPSLDAARARTVKPGAWALAAAILVAVGGGLAFLSTRDGGGGEEKDVDERLVAAARSLRERAPGVFEGFEPAGATERQSVEPDVSRAALIVLRPAGIVLEERPRFEWTGSAGATSSEVLLAGPDGIELWRRTVSGQAMDFPKDVAPLTAGTAYVVEVVPIGGASDGGRATRGFRVASGTEASAWQRAVSEVERGAPRDLRALLLAHAAARRGLLLEAVARVEEPSAGAGEAGAVASETRAWVRARLGWPEEEPAGKPDGR